MLTLFEAYFSKTKKFPIFSADFIESESLFDACKCFNLDNDRKELVMVQSGAINTHINVVNL